MRGIPGFPSSEEIYIFQKKVSTRYFKKDSSFKLSIVRTLGKSHPIADMEVLNFLKPERSGIIAVLKSLSPNARTPTYRY